MLFVVVIKSEQVVMGLTPPSCMKVFLLRTSELASDTYTHVYLYEYINKWGLFWQEITKNKKGSSLYPMDGSPPSV